MTVQIFSLITGAQQAQGLTVIIDVFRASNTILACLARGASSILPVGELEEAVDLKRQHSNHLLFGERKGLKPEGFDHGNSPAEASKLNLKGRDILLTTSAGSQGIVSAKKADEILIGSFANAAALVDYIHAQEPEFVSLVAMGKSGVEPAPEDQACARYLKAKLEGEEIDFKTLIQEVLMGEGADRLRQLRQWDDLEFCLRLNTTHIVPKMDRESARIHA